MVAKYTGELGKGFSGDRERAVQLQGQARILVQQLINQIKAPPLNGKGLLANSQKMPDGSVIHAYVQMIGVHPVIRTYIVSPTKPPEEEEEGFYTWSKCGFTYIPRPDGATPGSIGEFDPWYSAYAYRVGFIPYHTAKSYWFREDIYPVAKGDYKAHGNVDWISDEGEVLTWHGPTSRYFYYGGAPDPGGTGTTWASNPALVYKYPLNEVYAQGRKIYTTASGNIHGAAIYKAPNDKKWLLISTVQWYGAPCELLAAPITYDILGRINTMASGAATLLWSATML